MSLSFNENSFDKKLAHLQQSQESVQTLSFYCMHHKSHHAVIVQRWLKTYRSAQPKHRLALFYLANDIVQAAKRKHFDAFKQSFLPALKEALVLAKNDPYKDIFERVIKIWGDRGVFEQEYIEQLQSLICGAAVVLKVEKKNATTTSMAIDKETLLQSFRTKTFMMELERFQRLEVSIERAQTLLPNLNFDVGAGLKDHLKDKAQGIQISTELGDTHKKLSEFVLELERHLQQRRDLITLLEQAQVFYQTQLAEAGIVEKAYRTFGERIKQVKEQLDAMKMNLPASPPDNAPSPTPNDDPFAEGVEAAVARTDNIEAVEMDIDDEGKRSIVAASEDDDLIRSNESFLDSQISGPMPTETGYASPTQKNTTDPRLRQYDPESMPGGSTPTMDEEPLESSLTGQAVPTEAPDVTPAPTTVAAPGGTPFSAIEFLSQFLNSKPAPPPPPAGSVTTVTADMTSAVEAGLEATSSLYTPAPSVSLSSAYTTSAASSNPLTSYFADISGTYNIAPAAPYQSYVALQPDPTSPSAVSYMYEQPPPGHYAPQTPTEFLSPPPSFALPPPGPPPNPPMHMNLPPPIEAMPPPPQPYMPTVVPEYQANLSVFEPEQQVLVPPQPYIGTAAPVEIGPPPGPPQFELANNQQISEYLEDFTSNPDDIPDALYDSGGGMGSNQGNLTMVVSPDEDQGPPNFPDRAKRPSADWVAHAVEGGPPGLEGSFSEEHYAWAEDMPPDYSMHPDGNNADGLMVPPGCEIEYSNAGIGEYQQIQPVFSSPISNTPTSPRFSSRRSPGNSPYMRRGGGSPPKFRQMFSPHGGLGPYPRHDFSNRFPPMRGGRSPFRHGGYQRPGGMMRPPMRPPRRPRYEIQANGGY